MPRSDRDGEILALIGRYGLLIPAALSATLFAGLTEKAVERVLTRLLEQERLLSVPLIGRKRYYILSPQSARELGVDDERATRPMGVQALLQNFAMMAYCLLGTPRLERMTRGEFCQWFPKLAVRKILSRSNRTRYYIDKSDGNDGKVRLAWMVPDLGGNQRRLLRKVRREVEQRRSACAEFDKWYEPTSPPSLLSPPLKKRPNGCGRCWRRSSGIHV